MNIQMQKSLSKSLAFAFETGGIFLASTIGFVVLTVSLIDTLLNLFNPNRIFLVLLVLTFAVFVASRKLRPHLRSFNSTGTFLATFGYLLYAQMASIFAIFEIQKLAGNSLLGSYLQFLIDESLFTKFVLLNLFQNYQVIIGMVTFLAVTYILFLGLLFFLLPRKVSVTIFLLTHIVLLFAFEFNLIPVGIEAGFDKLLSFFLSSETAISFFAGMPLIYYLKSLFWGSEALEKFFSENSSH